MGKQTRQIIVDLPAGVAVNDVADFANAIWAISPEGSQVTVVSIDANAVNEAMNDRWKAAPEFRDGRWGDPK